MMCGRVSRHQVAVTEACVVAALDGNVCLRADAARQLGTLIAVHTAHRQHVATIRRVTRQRRETLHHTQPSSETTTTTTPI